MEYLHSILSTTFLLSIFGGLIYTIKDLPGKLYNKLKDKFLYTVKIYQYDELFYMIEDYFYRHHEVKYMNVEASTEERLYDFPQPILEKEKKIYFKQENNSFIIKYKGKKILISKDKEKLDKSITTIKDIYFSKYVFISFKGKEKVNEFLKIILHEYEKNKKEDSVKIWSCNSYGEWSEQNKFYGRSIDKVILDPNIKNDFVNDIKTFLKEEDWYKHLCIPYKRGYCFYGPPGNGKTSLAIAAAAMLNKDLYVLNLNSIHSDEYLMKAFSNLRSNSIFLIEDIDAAFSKREATTSKISFSTLLNCTDGTFFKHGNIIIITTNHFDQLDEALIRDGRIDMKIKIINPSSELINQYLYNFYGIISNKVYNECFSMSEVQEICIKNKHNYENAVKQLTIV